MLGLPADKCFDRFGRFGPYGFGYDSSAGGSGVGINTEKWGSEDVWGPNGQIDYQAIDEMEGLKWGRVQNQCYEENKIRFETNASISQPGLSKSILPRTAVVIRSWTGFEWNNQTILNFRAMINELSLNSGGEYTVHILLHVKDLAIPIWADEKIYQEVIQYTVPEEFWDIVTLWSEKYMEVIYTTPFGAPFENPSGSGIHGSYRSLHMPLQWFAHQHPEYEYFWNLEMDMRYTGHYYELLDRISQWSKEQPRAGLWERSAKYYIPALHGSWDDFTKLVESENKENEYTSFNRKKYWLGQPLDFPGRQWLKGEVGNRPPSCSGESNSSLCGVGEEADLITLNPIFDPLNSGWVLANDITGYNTSLPIPPRRNVIVAAGRLSKKLLNIMHQEMIQFGHSAFTEMFPPTIALHHGLKA